MSILYIRDKNGNFVPVKTIKGEPGNDYVLTDADKTKIAEMAAGLVEVPSDEHINQLINTALAAIPNAAEVGY